MYLEVAPGPGYLAIELANFRWGNAAAIPLPDQSFDFIVCRAAFKNFAEPRRASQEMRRVLKPCGMALIIDLRRDVTPSDIDRELDQYRVNAANRLFMKLTFRFMLIRRAYTRAEMERLTGEAGFRLAQLTETSIGFEVLLANDQ
jgi:ubiquinone/menaquinone biosynthesis C-methylase UbiE